MAFDEAYIPADRRRDMRVKYRVEAEICQWKRNKQGLPFTVKVEDFSPGGVGVIHGLPLELGSEYLIKVPRPNMDELVVLMTVVRVVKQDEETYLIGMELSSVMDRTQIGQLLDAINQRKRITSRRTRMLLLLLGVFGIGMSLLMR
jgi:c-di-GMP-binding flagellar brake protein YcgR